MAKHESGKLDVFTSAFYTHKTFALGFIRHEDQAVIKNKALASFQPPRSFDILHDLTLTVDLPGMIEWDTNTDAEKEADIDGVATKSPSIVSNTLGYKDNVGHYLIENISLEIGGSTLETLHGEWLHINEELHGQPGRRLENAKLGEVEDARVRSRIYVPLAFWFQGGSLSRALKLVAMQLHRVEFKVQYRAFADLLKGDTTDVFIREEEAVSESALSRLIGNVRSGAVSTNKEETLIVDAIGAFTMDFHGIFLNSETRAEYLNLQETALFTTTQQVNLGSTNGSEKQVPLDLKNAVYELVVAISGGDNTWGLEHAAEPLSSLSFSLSSTPRTLPALEPQFYRKVTQFLGPNTTSTDEKGIYYYNLSLKDTLNGTNVVSSYINASKIDDLRIRYSSNNDGNLYARAYNLVTIRNGFLGKVFQ
jgi:hypothetical protein